MIKWLKKQQTDKADSVVTDEQSNMPVPEVKQGFYTRFKEGLSKTRQHFGTSMGRLLLGKKTLDAALFDELKSLLIRADLGTATVQGILKQLQDRLARKELDNGDAVYQALQDQLCSLIKPMTATLSLPADKKPFVILMVGVNGAGKTTTIGKLAKQFQLQDKKVILAAGDTFRAAAIEQLQVWGERNHIQVIAQQAGSDSASVCYDALQAARARQADVLIVDTAGRLHTQHHLMDELKKVKRVLQKLDPDAPHATLLILDASIGQNALNQAREFQQAIGITGITMTKLDGTAKGGIVFAIANELGLPFYYLGVGEGIDDLRPFDAEQFVKAIFND